MLRSVKGVERKTERFRRWIPAQHPFLAKLDLLKTLVVRDLEARHKGSVLGNLWPLLNQLSQLLIYTYVFSIVLKVKLSLQGLPENNLTFGLWMFAGLLSWNAFTMALVAASVSVINQTNLIKKVVFPLALLPLVPVFSAFVESCFGLIALIVMVGLLAGTVKITLLLLPLIWLPQLLLTIGLSYLVAGLTVFLRDVPQTLGVLLNLWFYLTPLVYPASVIPEKWQSWVFLLNPMAAIAETYRDLILVGEVRHGQAWAIVSLVSVVVCYGGFWVYQRLRKAFADVL
ncbi:ABC-2 type transporter [Microseira wollei NIES-4236]|uniref:Transport permease protein n=1 Tax=Microseira wollei NIES-4236 TaxID=2530354 RepID=A0AAV3X8Q2_9CYAN|nr:ABC-2 type transporter [Microseira wollei NIES-4236]